jgi:hypothetical protein
MEPGPEDASSTNSAYLTDEGSLGDSIGSDITRSSSHTSDTATSGPPSIGSHPKLTDDSPPHSGPAGNPPSSPSVSTNQPPPQSPQPAPDPPRPSSPQPAPDPTPPSSPQPGPDPPHPSSPQPAPDNSPPLSPQPAPDNSHPTPSNPGTSTGSHQLAVGHSPPSMESQHPGVPESEKFFSELMKGKFKRRISGHGPGNVVQRELQGTVGPSAYVSTPSLFCQRSKHPSNKHSDLPLLNC